MHHNELIKHLPLEIWRGAAQAWQCDEMAHLNASFYVGFADEGLAALEAELGVFPNAGWRPTCHHIRFVREISAGTSLHMLAGVLGVSPEACDVLQVLVNSETGEVCAVIMTALHFDSRRDFLEQCERVQNCSSRLMVNAPKSVYAQAVPPRISGPAPNIALAVELGMTRSALGLFLPKEKCSDSNEISADAYISRLADATRRLTRLFEQAAQQYNDGDSKLGSAALECRLDYFRWAEVGSRFVIFSGFSEIGDKSSRRVVHWIFDADNGSPLCAVHTLEVNFDLQARKARRAHPNVRTDLAQYVVEALRPVA